MGFLGKFLVFVLAIVVGVMLEDAYPSLETPVGLGIGTILLILLFWNKLKKEFKEFKEEKELEKKDPKFSKIKKILNELDYSGEEISKELKEHLLNQFKKREPTLETIKKCLDEYIEEYGQKAALEAEVEEETKRIKVRRLKRFIREEAEKKVYGKIKTRVSLTEEEKEMVFDKYGSKCALCGATEGLHIHHKDKNSTNNRMDNLIVLCGVCHKKVHMKVR